MRTQHQMNISAEEEIRKGGCRHCGGRMSLRQRLSGARFCSADHEEKARRRHVDLISRRLDDSDISRNLRLCEDFKGHAPRPADGDMPEFRKNVEFCRRESLMLPGLDKLAESMRLGKPFEDERLLEPAPCPPRNARLAGPMYESRLSMPGVNLRLASDDRFRSTRVKVAVAARRSAA